MESLRPTLTEEQSRKKSIPLVVVLSIVLPGTAELYLGGSYTKLGLLRLVSFILAWGLVLGIIGIFLVPLIWIASILDGIRLAVRMRRLRAGPPIGEG